MPADPAEAIALFRYRVVAEATNERLSSAERGLVVREREERRAQVADAWVDDRRGIGERRAGHGHLATDGPRVTSDGPKGE